MSAGRLILAMLVFLPVSADAAILGSCAIVVNRDGTMRPNPAVDVLSSRAAGGSAALVTVSANSLLCSLLNLLDCYSVSAPAPASFAASPQGAGTGVTFSSAYSLDGAAEKPGATATRVANGAHSLAIQLEATRAGGIFPSGSYEAVVTVRCE